MKVEIELSERYTRLLKMIAVLKNETPEEIAVEIMTGSLDSHLETGYLGEIEVWLKELNVSQ